MDNGEEIPGLNEDWTFAGAKLFEWIAGFMSLLIASELFFSSASRSMPVLVMIMVGTTFSLASLRRTFPDEERGVRNLVMMKLGFAPPGIPRPAQIQPLWSGAPIKEINEKMNFSELGLQKIFPGEDLNEE